MSDAASPGRAEPDGVARRLVLVPVGPGASHGALLDEAVAEARWRRASVILLHVLDLPGEFPVDSFLLSPVPVAVALEQTARADLEALAAALPADVAPRVRVEYGRPWRVICDVARSEDVVLVAIGARAHRLLDGLLGTTASRVVGNVDRSVLVVHPDDDPARRSLDPTRARRDAPASMGAGTVTERA